jgi:restriction system protein
MSLWLCRAGKHGEHEKRFFDTNRIYLTWEGLEKEDLGKAGDLKQLKSIMRKAYPGVSDTHLGRSAGQVWTFVTDMDPGDWIVVPRKTTPRWHLQRLLVNTSLMKLPMVHTNTVGRCVG